MMRCKQCGFIHTTAGDLARCDNARKIGLDLRRRLTLAPVKCTKALHDSWIDGDWDTFMAMTEALPNDRDGLVKYLDRVVAGETAYSPERVKMYMAGSGEWTDEHSRKLSRNCIRCHSTLTRIVSSVSAAEAMRGGAR